MSTAVMWLLLFVVVALGILIAALSKTKFTTKKDCNHRYYGCAQLCCV